MNNTVSKVVKKYLENLKNDKDLSVLIFGSALDSDWTSNSDIDLFLISDDLNTSVETREIDGVILEIQKDNSQQLLSDMESERGNIRNRNLSTMIDSAHIVKVGKDDIDKLKAVAREILDSKTKYSPEDEKGWKNSIDDYISKCEKDIKRDDGISFLLDSSYALQNILDLFLAKNNSFLPQPKKFDEKLKIIDLEFRNTLCEYAKAASNKEKLALLRQLLKSIK